MKLSKFILVILVFLTISCRESSEIPAFVKENEAYIIPEKKFDDFALRIYNADSAKAVSLINKAYSIADSLSLKAESNLTLLRFAGGMAERFFSVNSELRSEEIYRHIIDAELSCKCITPNDYKHIEWKKNLLECNAVGKTVNNIQIVGKGLLESELHDIIDKTCLIFLHGEECEKCKELESLLTSSNLIQNLFQQGELKLVSLYAGDDTQPVDTRNAPQNWVHINDANCAIRYSNAFDARLMPSVYIISADKTVLLKGSIDINEIEAKLNTLDLINH